VRNALGASIGLVLAAVFFAAPAIGEVVCRKKTGTLTVREACKNREVPYDLSVVEPSPTARAYGCSNATSDTTVEACAGRASKGIVGVTANTEYAGFTCFQLDPSIDAGGAIVVASLNSHNAFAGGKVNALISADAYGNYTGCPPNSVVVVTGRHTLGSVELGLESVILSVDVVVP
jgi:hypothetical protein